MESMFKDASNIESLDLSSFDSYNVTNMKMMFDGCTKLKTIKIDVNKFDTRNVLNMENLFYNCKSLENFDFSKFDTNMVTSMKKMFSGCESFKSLNLSSFSTSKVKDMEEMFSGLTLTSLDLSSFSTNEVESMKKMFYLCHNLKYLNLIKFNAFQCVNFELIMHGTNGTNVILSKDLKKENEYFIKSLGGGENLTIEYL